jgi:hypothetical protein
MGAQLTGRIWSKNEPVESCRSVGTIPAVNFRPPRSQYVQRHHQNIGESPRAAEDASGVRSSYGRRQCKVM